jgi:hypothetical protein
MGVGVHFLLATALLLAAVLVGTANAHSDAPSRAVGVRNVRTRVRSGLAPPPPILHRINYQSNVGRSGSARVGVPLGPAPYRRVGGGTVTL